ncbi:hypothetical protein AND_009585 [Anopheles darlingi]|uniref:Leucine-rich repeat protein n=1 Tax=Anopheles darlingi TaxID=43151 RepID=W5J5Z1_ANODA|nr:hypothetical protein AND_009585 [Anopheles darlingi]
MAYNASAFLLLFCVLVIPLSSGVHVYQCSPGTEETLCVVNNLAYSPGQDRLPQVNRSDTVNRIHLRCSRYYYYSNWNSRSGKDLLSVYDVVLHSKVLRSPRSATVINCHLHTLVMPLDLEVGDFFNNYVSEVKTDPTQSYNLRYLDLSHNNLYDLGNLSVLVNLQTLKLDGNAIDEINPETFARMTNLSILSLGNSMTEIDFTSVSFVSMRELDLESNQLAGLDVASMMRACPALQLLPIEYNPMPKDVAQRIVKELTRYNVTYYNEGDKASYSDSSCDSDEYSVDRACFLETKNKGSGSFLKAFVLILVGIVLFGVFGLSARWIWHEMRY